VKSPKTLTDATHLPVLAAIPEIITEEDVQRQRKKMKTLLIIAACVLVVGIIVFHFFIMDLDVLWARLTRKYL
jgi:hypothetical protein